MINFDEEIRKLKPVYEVDQAEDAIYSNDLQDITDILLEMVHEVREQTGR